MSENALPRAPGKPGVNPYLIAGLVSFGTLFEFMNSTALSVGLNNIAGNLGGTPEESDGIITTYLVANAAVMPISAWAATYFGRKRYFIACVILFVVASALCAMAWSIESLMVFRALQGAAAAGNAASETSIIADSFEPQKRGQGFAIYGIAVTIGPAIGPMFGGYMVDNYSWQWIFWLNVPTGLAVAALFYLLLEDKPALRKETRRVRSFGLRLDWTGFLLAVVGLMALTLLLDQGQQEDWFDSRTIVVATVIAATCLAILPVWEYFRSEPILDFRLFANTQFAVSVTLMFVVGVLVIGGASIFPLWLQQSFDYTPTTAGLVLGISALVAMLPTPPSGIMTGKVATAPMVIGAFSVISVGLWWTSQVYGDFSFPQLALVWGMQQVSLAFLFVPLQSHALIGVPDNRIEHVGSFLNLARNLGGAVGTAIGLNLVERGRQGYREDLIQGATPFSDEWVAATQRYGGEAALSAVVDQQAAILAYENVFFVLFVMTMCCIPLAFLLRGKPEPEQAA